MVLGDLLIFRVFNEFSFVKILFFMIVCVIVFFIFFLKFNLVREWRLENKFWYSNDILIIFFFKFKVFKWNNLRNGWLLRCCILFVDKLM